MWADEGPPPSSPLTATSVSDDAIASPLVEEAISVVPPGRLDLQEFLDVDPPHWANELIDEHALIYRETRSETEVLGRGSVFGMTSLGFSGSVTGEQQGPLWWNPKFGWHFLSGPDEPDVRSQFYDLAMEINFAQPLNDRINLHLQATPTWASDFDNKGGEAFRMLGGGLLAVELTPEWTFVGGATYLDREDLPWMPIVGVRIATEQIELDLLLPRPRLAIRTTVDEDLSEEWLYVSGDVGGGAWAFEREGTGVHDVFNYRDLRLLVGLETRDRDGSRQVLEAGYVFDRQIDFEIAPGRLTPGETWLLRWGSTY